MPDFRSDFLRRHGIYQCWHHGRYMSFHVDIGSISCSRQGDIISDRMSRTSWISMSLSCGNDFHWRLLHQQGFQYHLLQLESNKRNQRTFKPLLADGRAFSGGFLAIITALGSLILGRPIRCLYHEERNWKVTIVKRKYNVGCVICRR